MLTMHNALFARKKFNLILHKPIYGHHVANEMHGFTEIVFRI